MTWDLVDAEGSVRDVSDSNGNILDHLAFAAFGQVTFESAPSVHHLGSYAGGLLDPVTGDVHFGHRNLNVIDGIWGSEDPLGFLAGDTNLTRDVRNSPTFRMDPTGLADDDLDDMRNRYPPVLDPLPREDPKQAKAAQDAADKRASEWTERAPTVNSMSARTLIRAWRNGQLPRVVVLSDSSPCTQDMMTSPGLGAARQALLAKAEEMQGLDEGTHVETRRGAHNPNNEVREDGGPSAQASAKLVWRVLSNNAQGYVGSYSWRAEMRVRVLGNDRNRNGVMIKVTINWELWDPKSKKSANAFFEATRAATTNETRPFYPESTCDMYFRWTEEYTFRSPLWPLGKPDTGKLELSRDETSDEFDVPFVGDAPFESDSGGEYKRPSADFKNGDVAKETQSE